MTTAKKKILSVHEKVLKKPLVQVIPIGIMGVAGAGKDTFAKMLQEKFVSKGVQCFIAHYADALKQCCALLGWSPSDKNAKLSEFSSRYPKDTDFAVSCLNVLIGSLRCMANSTYTRIIVDKTISKVSPGNISLEYLRRFSVSVSNSVKEEHTFLQWFGTEFARNLFDKVWIAEVASRAQALGSCVLLIPDTRYENEALLYPEFNILVDTPSNDARSKSHSSEQLAVKCLDAVSGNSEDVFRHVKAHEWEPNYVVRNHGRDIGELRKKVDALELLLVEDNR